MALQCSGCEQRVSCAAYLPLDAILSYTNLHHMILVHHSCQGNSVLTFFLSNASLHKLRLVIFNTTRSQIHTGCCHGCATTLHNLVLTHTKRPFRFSFSPKQATNISIGPYILCVNDKLVFTVLLILLLISYTNCPYKMGTTRSKGKNVSRFFTDLLHI